MKPGTSTTAEPSPRGTPKPHVVREKRLVNLSHGHRSSLHSGIEKFGSRRIPALVLVSSTTVILITSFLDHNIPSPALIFIEKFKYIICPIGYSCQANFVFRDI